MTTHATTTDRIGDAGVRVLLAVVGLGHAGGGVTVRDVAAHLHLPKTTVWKHLEVLRAAGLITWVPHAHGTIRPTVEYASLTGGSGS